MAAQGHLRDYARYTGLGLELAVPVIAGSLLGWHLDVKLSVSPWLTVAGSLAGIALGLVSFIATVLRLEEKGKDEQK